MCDAGTAVSVQGGGGLCVLLTVSYEKDFLNFNDDTTSGYDFVNNTGNFEKYCGLNRQPVLLYSSNNKIIKINKIFFIRHS